MAKKTLHIKLYLSELTYNIADITHITGTSRYDGANDERTANMKTSDDDEVQNQIFRLIGNAFATLKVKLAEYLDEKGTSSNDILLGGGKIVDQTKAVLQLVLKVPTNFNFSVRETISASMHDYIVNFAVAQWFNMTDKADAKEYFDLSARNIAELREAINKRIRPVRHDVDDDTDECCAPISFMELNNMFDEIDNEKNNT